MIYTTLNELRGLHSSGFARLLSYLGKTQPDDDPLPLVTVLDSNDLDDAILCLRVCPDVAAEFARWCADRANARADAEAAGRVARAVARAAKAARWCADRANARAAAGWTTRAAYLAAYPDEATERQAQADKLRELLS